MTHLPKIAFVHDWLTSWGGAERVLEALLEIYPQAQVFTLVYNPRLFQHSPIGQVRVTTSFLDRLPLARRKWRSYLPLMPLAVEQLDLRGFPIVVSLSNAVAHGVLLQPDQLHINYIYTPMRYAWRLYHEYLHDTGLHRGVKGWLAWLVLHYLRLWDFNASHRVDHFVAISHWVAASVKRVYRRAAQVIYPPVEVSSFHPSRERSDSYLTVSRLVPYKRLHLLVEAFSQMGCPLDIVGDGPERKRLEALAAPNVKILGWQPDEVVRSLFERARAFVHVAEEDFGITLVEAMAAGCPVIAYGRGGARETVIPGKTGVLFEEQSIESIQQAVRAFETLSSQFDPLQLHTHARQFSRQRFQREFADMLAHHWERFGER